jgi:hypothetical protein
MFSKDKGERIKDELWKRRERDGERKRGHGQRKDVIVNREAEKRCARVRDRESCLMTKLSGFENSRNVKVISDASTVREPWEIVLNPDRFLLDRLYSVK